jgi:hypothetical protein
LHSTTGHRQLRPALLRRLAVLRFTGLVGEQPLQESGDERDEGKEHRDTQHVEGDVRVRDLTRHGFAAGSASLSAAN